jgi:hypothetical protein
VRLRQRRARVLGCGGVPGAVGCCTRHRAGCTPPHPGTSCEAATITLMRLALVQPFAAGPFRDRRLQRGPRGGARTSARHRLLRGRALARRHVRGPPRLRSAHEFVWRHRRAPYDLVVYQLGNSSHHDYQWPYLFRYPGPDRAARRPSAPRPRRGRCCGRGAPPTTGPSSPRTTRTSALRSPSWRSGFDSHLYYLSPMTRAGRPRPRG